MCTTDCKCYAGANGEIRDLWTGYGDEVLQKHLRNDIETMELNPEGIPTWPLIWTDDPAEA